MLAISHFASYQIHQLLADFLIGGLQIADDVADKLLVLVRHQGVSRAFDAGAT